MPRSYRSVLGIAPRDTAIPQKYPTARSPEKQGAAESNTWIGRESAQK
jgi:hypothetical protein